jgi:hypothetical protein
MKPLSYADTPARSLVDERLLIIATHLGPDLISGEQDAIMHVHAQRVKGKRPSHVCFRAGVVVRQQLEAQRFFPVWARLSLVQGKAHDYYMLDLACTTEVRGEATDRHWHVNLDPETNTWKGGKP